MCSSDLKGAGVSLEQVQQANFIPELFHCSGFAIMDDATADGTLYHGRVLDYATDWRLQEHAVLMVAEPDGKIPFLNVSFAGFIGSVTGLNMEKISIGEMGGRGFGLWDGVPMAILVRMKEDHDKVIELGGLYVLGTEHHDARRIDNQLRGRAGRQGDPGSSQFYVSVDDALSQRFGRDRIQTSMGSAGLADRTAVEKTTVTKSIGREQVKV